MSILLFGLNHRSSPVAVRENLTSIGTDETLKRLRAKGWGEAVVLSTCNRFEIYAVSAGADETSTDSLDLKAKNGNPLENLLKSWAGENVEWRPQQVYRGSDEAAVKHLFSVAAGLDSLVVGEAEILGQVKQAYETARAAGMTGKLTNVLFQRALYVGKLVRSETGIALGQMSVASVAVALAERIFGNLAESSVLILGAGKMAELSAKHLLSGKVDKLCLANRTWEKAVELAAKFKAEAVRWEDFPAYLERVDIVIGSTGSPKPILTAEIIADAARARKGRSLFLIDIAMPRDVEESAGDLDHVYLYTMRDLEGIVQENVSRRYGEIDAAKALVDRKSAEFEAWLDSVENGSRASLSHSARGVSVADNSPEIPASSHAERP